MNSESSKYKIKLLFSFFFLLFYATSTAQNCSSDMSFNNNTSKKKPSKEVELLLNIAEKEQNSAVKLEYYEKIIDLTDSLQENTYKVKAIYHSALTWKKRGEFLKATELFKEAVSITKKTGDINDMYLIMIDLGDAYRTNNKYKEALHVFDQTFEYFQKENNTKKLAKISNRKAAVYLEILFSHEAYYQIRKNGTKTPESFLDSLKSHKELNSIYNELNKWLNYSTRLSNENNYYDLVISNLNILASLKATILDYQSALKYYDLGLSKIEKFQIKEELPLLLINKARILGVRRLENIKLAIQIGEEGYKYALEQQEYIYMLLGSSVLEENYAALGNYERSYYYLKQFRILSNSLNNENLQLNLKTLELKTKIVDRELDIQKRKFKLYKTYIYSIVFFIILTTFHLNPGR